jgi:hypothetical protein
MRNFCVFTLVYRLRRRHIRTPECTRLERPDSRRASPCIAQSIARRQRVCWIEHILTRNVDDAARDDFVPLAGRMDTHHIDHSRESHKKLVPFSPRFANACRPASSGLSAPIVGDRLALQRWATPNLIRKLLGYHDDGCIEVAADDLRQNRGVDDA